MSAFKAGCLSVPEFQDLPQQSGDSPDSGSDQTENNSNNQRCAVGRLRASVWDGCVPLCGNAACLCAGTLHASVQKRCVPLELVMTGDKGGSQLSRLSSLSWN